MYIHVPYQNACKVLTQVVEYKPLRSRFLKIKVVEFKKFNLSKLGTYLSDCQ